MNRRHFLQTTLAAGTLAALKSVAGELRTGSILLRSSWQTVNIGDIAHTPGIVQLIQDHLPGVEVRLWPGNIGNGVEEMLRRNFPKLAFVKTADDIKAAFAECDFMLHGSGPSVVAQAHLARWHKETGKPFGIYGITLPAVTPKPVTAEAFITYAPLDDGLRGLLDAAKFIYFRDTISLKGAQDAGIKCPVMEFGPDAAFGVKLRNDEAAAAFLKANGLEDGKFLCAIPRLRNSPYWIMKNNNQMNETDKKKHEVNEKYREQDHAKLREAMITFIKETGMKVLVCPEDESHMQVGKENLIDPLPENIKSKVVWREKYWLTDEAVSTYARSLGLLSMDMHSPIMAVANGIPAIHCRFWTQTVKAQMWRDIGLGEWLFDMDEEKDGSKIAAAVLAIAKDAGAAKEKVAKAMAFVRQRQKETIATVGKQLPAK
ncbi:MAG TPA: polysaccharide pyruvyl transferase family protein [Planctomycetota bacterium]|nr:polysaccharide pyruvyl transferase family protein [Planctomycetota bacterium]